jgi:WD40 repeat protein
VYTNNFKNIAVGTTSSTIHIFDAASYQSVSQLVGHRAAVCCLSVQEDVLISGGDYGCCGIYIWDVSNWTVRSKLCYHSAAVCSIISIPNTDYIVSCSMDKTLNIYNHKSFTITDHHTSTTPYTHLLYFEHLHKVAVSTPTCTL